MSRSLEDIHRSIPILSGISKWKKLLAFAGPGYLVAVGYMDPGNWATDLAGGSKFGYALLSVVLLSGLMAMLLQHLSLKLGIVTGRDLAQACHDHYPPLVRKILWILAEIAITACDLAEVIGSAIALNLLFGLPILFGVIITAFDTLLLLLLQSRGIRYLEALVISLIAVIIASFGVEIFLSRPDILPLLHGFIPTAQLFTNTDMLYIAIGILGATVMPHNLYLHSALVQSRDFGDSHVGKKEAITYATIDSNIALTLAMLVNAAILIVSAATFFSRGMGNVAEIQDAYHLLSPLLGTGIASTVFALALLASGHNSTITGTLAGQVVMEGFINIHLPSWLRRLITRLLAIIPAIFIVSAYGTHGLAQLLVFSQVVLSMQLPFAVIPLVWFTGERKYMGRYVNAPWLKVTSWMIAGIITLLNFWLIGKIFSVM
jgi:manganese transport protein